MSTLRFRGKCVLSPPTREDAITCLAFSIKGDYVASGGLDRRLHIFALADGKLHYSIVTPSPIKSLIWLPGAEQTLVCACHNGVLINIIIRPADIMLLNCFRAKLHTVEFMAADASAIYLATGHGRDVRIWKGDGCHEWSGHGFLGVPKTPVDIPDAEIILTGLHWCGNGSVSPNDVRLITTYRHHGIQLWDVVRMSIIQSINLTSTLLGSSLSPNGLQIAVTKRGGYDIYSLDSGVLLHSFAHDIPQAMLDGDKYPSAFLPTDFVFCGATIDGTITLWDGNVGDRLQSVQHRPGSTLHALAIHATEAGTVLLATASHDEVKVWHTIPSANHRGRDHKRFTKPIAVAAWAIIICALAVLLKWVF